MSQSSPSSAEDGVAVLVELRRARRLCRHAVVLHRRRRELERDALGGLAVDDVAVRDGLRIGCGFERVLHAPSTAR